MFQPHDAELFDYHQVHWSPTVRLGVLWNALSCVLTVAGVFMFAGVAAASGLDPFRPMTDGHPYLATFVTLGILAVMLALHELCHGLVMRRFGARPRYGAGIVARVLPVFYCSASGYTFTREQYALAALTPVVAISLIGSVLITVSPMGAWLVIPLGLHAGGAIGDLWATVLMLRQPKGSLIEDTDSGVIIHRPSMEARVAAD